MAQARIQRLQTSFGRIFYQRCFYLFLSLVTLISVAPFFAELEHGRTVVTAANVFVLVAAVAAVGRSTLPFVIAVLLGLPALAFRVLGTTVLENPTHDFIVSSAFFLAFYIVALVYLLRYVFNPEVMTDDKLFGAAAAFLLLGVAWAVGFDILQRLEPSALGLKPGDPPKLFIDLLFMSMGYLTSNGPGDLMVYGAKARTLAILEQVFGTLFVAILIARLAGIYPPKADDADG